MNIKLEIPESFLQGEELCGYYVSPEMKKVWAVELDLLAEFARVCKKYNLKWCINYGTLLGAARHKGFIPWDDDIDTVMMLSDYRKLCEVAPDEFKHPYHLRSGENDPERLQNFGKFHNEDTTMLERPEIRLIKQGKSFSYSQGIWIDVFPLYDVPDDEELFKRICRRAKFYLRAAYFSYTMSYNYVPAKGFVKRMIKGGLAPFARAFHITLPYGKFFSKFKSIINSCVYPGSKKVIDFWPMYNDTHNDFIERMPTLRSYFDEIVYLPFEMLELPAPARYEDLLTQYYGDWHKYEIRGTHTTLYDTERSYKYYAEHGIPEDK